MKTIHIFDMDDTLLVTPTFADVMNQGPDACLDEFLTHVKHVFLLFSAKEVMFRTMGDYIVVTDGGAPAPSHLLTTMSEKLEGSETAMSPEAFKREYGIRRSSVKDAIKALNIRDGHIIVAQVRGFHANPKTIGSLLNHHVVEVYNTVSDKMIVTGRAKNLIPDIKKRLAEVGMEYPNHGLHCFPASGHKSIADFKVHCILETIRMNQWEEVHFYEDREDWLKNAALVVRTTYPHIAFIEHHISNVHDRKTLSTTDR